MVDDSRVVYRFVSAIGCVETMVVVMNARVRGIGGLETNYRLEGGRGAGSWSTMTMMGFQCSKMVSGC